MSLCNGVVTKLIQGMYCDSTCHMHVYDYKQVMAPGLSYIPFVKYKNVIRNRLFNT